MLLIALAARFAVTPGRRTTASRALLAALILLLTADTLFAVLNLFRDDEGVSPAATTALAVAWPSAPPSSAPPSACQPPTAAPASRWPPGPEPPG